MSETKKETQNNMLDNDIMEFTETINLENCKQYINISYEQYIDVFNVKEQSQDMGDKNKYTTKMYFNYIIKNIRNVVKKNKKVNKRKYKYAKNQKNGRLYVKGFGVQSLPSNVKKYLLQDCGYVDYDMDNAHFVILRHLTKENNIETPLLDDYVVNRRRILKDNVLTKLDVIMCLYSDINIFKNSFLKNFHNELTSVKSIINNKYCHLITSKLKSKNQKSSTLSYILNYFENTYIQLIIKKYKCDVPYFDGFLTTDKINISDLNKITEKEKIKWSVKSMKTSINLHELLKSDKQKIIDYFELLDGSGENDIAKRFLKLLGDDKNKYILYRDGDKVNYYYYNEYNILIDCGKTPPSSLNQDITNILKKDLKYHQSQAVLLLDDDEEKNCRRIYDFRNKQFQKNSFKKSIIEELKYFIEDSRLFDKIDVNNDLLVFNNELFDFKIGEFRKIERNDYILTHLTYNRPVENLEIQKELLQMLFDIFNSEEIVRYFLDTVSYPLFTNKFEKFNIWTGCGSNGKGILLTLLEKTYDKYFKIADNKFLTSKIKGGAANPDLADCKGKKFVMVSEPECDGDNELKFNIQTIKKITGRDSITTRYLNKNTFTFTPNFTLFCQSNQVPTIEKNDNANIRRFQIMEFKNKFVDDPQSSNEKKIDRTLKDKFKTSEYYEQFMLMLIKNIRYKYNNVKIEIPKSIMKTTNDYFENNNVLKEWLDTHYISTNDKESFILQKELYEDFKNSYDFQGMGKSDFKYNMKSNGFDYVKNQRSKNKDKKPMDKGRGYYGLLKIVVDDFVPDEDEPDEDELN